MSSANASALCSKCAAEVAFSDLQTPEVDGLDALLRSNLPAPASFYNILNRGADTYTRYSDEIARLELALEQAHSARNALGTYLKRVHSACASPIRLLPDDVLGEIFGHILPPEEGYRAPRGEVQFLYSELDRLAQYPLLVLAQVCYCWNQVAMKTPKFWSVIAARLDHWPEAHYDDYLAVLAASLRRSGTHPLSISLRDYGTIPVQTSAVMSLLAPHASRWRSLRICGISQVCDLLRRWSVEFPNLQTLYLDDCEVANLDLVETCPRLKCATFRGDPRVIPRLPWAQLDQFTFTSTLPASWMHHLNFPHIPWNTFSRGSSLKLVIPSYNIPDMLLPSNPTESRIQSLTLKVDLTRSWVVSFQPLLSGVPVRSTWVWGTN